jgi:hypothetical protein
MTKYTDDELLPKTQEQAEYHRRLQDPYASLSTGLPEQRTSAVATAVEEPGLKATATKEFFEAETRRILGLYIPGTERGGQLRPHHRAFITRNLVRSPAERFKVLRELKKYDLSSIPGFEARFNREDDDLTDAKLNEIEKAAGVD